MQGISCFFITGITGCALNPFIVISGSMMTGTFPKSQWIYFLSPILGILLGGIMDYILTDEKEIPLKELYSEKIKASVVPSTVY